VKILALALLASCSMINSGGPTTPPPMGGGGGGAAGPAGGPAVQAGPDADGMVVMPNLVGKTEAEAQALVRAAGFKSEMEHSAPVDCGDSAPRDAGKINCQNVDAGARVKAYTLVQVNIYEPQRHDGRIIRSQLDPIRGKTIEEGKQMLAQLGFKGSVRLEHPTQFVANCALGHICDVQPEAGVSTDADARVVFVVNEDKVKISTPDP
jgi:serine/threonine-protein kinase